MREQACALAWSAATNCWPPKAPSYHGPGTCTFYGTANSNQMLLEAMGLHVPGAAFVHPHDGLRDALTREAVASVLRHGAAAALHCPSACLVDARVIVNAMVALLATGGSTNHLIHWVAVARAAGFADRLERLRRAVGTRCRCWPACTRTAAPT